MAIRSGSDRPRIGRIRRKQPGSFLKKNNEFHELEYLRNTLIDEVVQLYDDLMNNNGYLNEAEPSDLLKESKAINSIMDHFPEVDEILLRNTAIQFARTRNRRFSRELFRILKAALEKKQYSKIQGKDNFWVLAFVNEKDEILASVTSARNKNLIIGIIVFILTIIFAIFVARSISKPIKKLIEDIEVIGS